MSKIPIDRNGKLRIRGIYSMKGIDVINPKDKQATDTADKTKNIDAGTTGDNKKLFCSNYLNLVPKMSLSLDRGLEKNPRILDLREKLNEITKKQDRNVDKETKGLINGITQLVEEKEQDESGPYSLLFDLQPSTFKESIENDVHSQSLKNSTISINKSAERLPNVINFDEKPMREFEYSCENQIPFPVTKTFNTHSRSDLCLQLKSQMNPLIYDTNLSPNDNSLNRTNEENSLDDSLGILTPDQMDDICYLENAFSPTVEGLPIFCDNNESKVSPDCSDTPSTEKTDSNSAVSTIQNDEFERNDCTAPLPRNIESAKTDKLSKSCDNLTAQHTSSLTTKLPANSVKSEAKESKMEVTDTVKDELIPNVILDDEFMPSIHSSILEPVSSIAETTVNLELPLDCKLENRLVVQRIEQTPSPEDLPLDSSDINGEISYNSQFSSSTLHDSQTYSDNKNDYQKSMETSKVSNSFITSITSITSLDGYQGDGEMSRPVSRAADHSIEPREDVIEMEWQNVPVTRRADPMTDSDFFTESDADGLDDHMHKGDRKAQVIDGALYGGKNGNGNPPLIVNRNDDSCMESSGVYTDFENHRQSPVFLNVIDDMSPEGSTPSTHSELSQKNFSSGQTNTYITPLEECMNEETFNPIIVDEDKTPKNTSKRNSLNSEKDVRSNAKNKDEKRSFTLKKYKMPKRDVPSKLKTMLTNRSTDADNSVQNSPKNLKKTDRRESLTKKNSLDIKTDYKMKSFKDIKSKVDCSFSLQRSQTACSVSRMLSSKSTNTNMKPKSRHMRMRVELGSAAGSGKSSLHSSQSDLSATSTPLGKHPVNRFPLLRNGKKRDSVAAPTPPPARPPPTPPQPPAQVKKNGVVPKLSSSPVAVRARASLAPPPSPRKPAARRTPAQRPNTLPTNNKEPPRVTAAVGPRTKRAPTPARVPPAAPRETQAAALAHAAKGVEALGVLVQYLVFRLDALNGGSWRLEAERWRGVAAAERTSAERADQDRQQRAQKDLDTIAECLGKISELEMEVSSKEEVNARLQAAHASEVASLANDIKGLKESIDSLKREVAESRARLHAHGEIERTLRAQLDAARAEVERADTLRAAGDMARSVCNTGCNTVCNKSDAACDPVCCELECEIRFNTDEELSTDANELAAEVRSLRAVVELKQAEMASLRSVRAALEAERARRAAAERDARAARHAAEELKERAAARQRDADRLRDDNRRLRDAAARDRDQAARVAALNEELRYKLRQKSQVVSLLAGGGYIQERRARTSSGSSLRSASPDSPPAPRSPAPAPRSPAPRSPAPADTPPLPAVKGVVEKHDSVSWVLEIEETPEEVASRLARRSSFRSSGSPAAGAGTAGSGTAGSGSGSGTAGSGSGSGTAGAGTKRRGTTSPGGSPAPASPAPAASKLFRPGDLDFASPPLKESAGEAIYIYDDRHY